MISAEYVHPEGKCDTVLALRYVLLVRSHRELDEMIKQEAARPSPDFLRLQEMKRRKLRSKEQIVEIERFLDGETDEKPQSAVQ